MNNNYAKVAFVIFGPANVGKSSIIGYIKTHDLSSGKFLSEINKIKKELGNVYQSERLFSYFVDDAKDEYTTNADKSHGETKGTSKYAHIAKIGDFFLIDTPGGNDYEVQRFKGISLANIGIFAIEMKQLLNLIEEDQNLNINKYLKTVKQFFSSWYVWQKLHGTKNTIILLTKYDAYASEQYFEKAKMILYNIIGENPDITVIPTSINVKTEERSDINIYTKMDCDWYNGMTLMQAIEEKFALISKDVSPSDLLMFYNRRFDNVPGVGIIIKWKISSGSLNIRNRLIIAPVLVNKKYIKVEASIKSMHNEYHENIDFANYGEIVNIALSNIVYENSTIQRNEVRIQNTSIIVESGREIKVGDHIKAIIGLKQCTKEELLELKKFSYNTQVRILWFGKVLFPNIYNIENSDDGDILLDLVLTNNQIALPCDSFPKRILLQNQPKNEFELQNNYDCIVTDIYNSEDVGC